MTAIAVMSCAVMQLLDTSVVNVSLPHIAGSLSSSVDEATWVLTSYLVANAIILPITGWLAGVFGRKRLLLLAVTGFTLSSLLCGLAPNLPMLIVFRVVQGLTGGGLQPLSQAVLLEEFPGKEQGKAMAFWSLGIIAAPILGPTLGGWITDTWTWRWVFFINLPVGVLSLLLISQYVVDPHYLRRRSLGVDAWGIGMLAVGMGALQIMLDKGQEKDWFGSNLICALCAIALVCLSAFVLRELQAKDPIVHFGLLRSRTFCFRCRIGHHDGLHSLRQPGAPAAVYANPAGMDGDDRGYLEQSPWSRYCAVHAYRGLPSGQGVGRALDADLRIRTGQPLLLRLCAHDARFRYLGHLLDSDRPGLWPGFSSSCPSRHSP